MKKFLIVLGVIVAFVATTAFVTTNNANINPGSGDGVTTCEVYGAYGYTASVVYKVITPIEHEYGALKAEVKLNKKNETNKPIYVVVELRNASHYVIESQRLKISEHAIYGWLNFKHRGSNGEVYYVTINSASCN